MTYGEGHNEPIHSSLYSSLELPRRCIELNPKVSICIPAFQQPTCLRRALDSVFFQTFKDYEVIISDDSTDNSVENVVREYNRERAGVKYHKNAVTKGSPENWNAAIELATGEYIKILHHDDCFSGKD